MRRLGPIAREASGHLKKGVSVESLDYDTLSLFGLAVNYQWAADMAGLVTVLWNNQSGIAQGTIPNLFDNILGFGALNTQEDTPSWAWVKTKKRLTLVIAGTSTLTQGVKQTVSAATDLTPFLGAHVCGYNLAAAEGIYDDLRKLAGYDRGELICFGHSYGGTLAQCVAGLVSLRQRTVRCAVATIGSPKWADIGWSKVNHGVGSIRYQNLLDFVPCLPATELDLPNVAALLPEVIERLNNRVIHRGSAKVLHPPANVQTRYLSPPATQANVFDVIDWLTKGVTPAGQAHSSALYSSNLARLARQQLGVLS